MSEFPDPIPGILQHGTINLFVGSPHAGKTIELTDLAIRIRDGRSFFGHPTQACPVGIITTDHYWAKDQGKWFTRAGWPDIPHVCLLDTFPDLDWLKFLKNPAERKEVLRSCLDRLALPPGGLLLLDIGQAFITDKINDYAATVAGIMALLNATGKRQLTTMSTTHMSKQKEGAQYKKLQERIAGSVALVGYSYTIFTMESHEETGEPFKRFSIISRDAPSSTHEIVHDKQTGLFVPYTGLVDDGKTAETDRPTQIFSLLPQEGLSRESWFNLAIEKGYVTPKQGKTFMRAITILLERRLVIRTSFGFYAPRPTH